MKIRLIWVGRTKERYLREGIDKYLRLLKGYADMEMIEVREAKGLEHDRARDLEGERILKLGSPFILLDERGKEMTSVEFASFLEAQGSSASFAVGGAFGVSESVRAAAVNRISLSRMTFTHEMSRLILLEQLFRAFTIMRGKGYHH